jgi:hypothetical protein
MEHKRWPLFIGILGLAFFVYWLKQKEQKISERHFVTKPYQQPQLQSQSYARTTVNSKSQKQKSIPLNVKNIQQMTQTLKQAALQSSLQTTLDQLQKLQLQPSLYQDANPETGTLSVVRTEKPLPGTRYFHAQYFSGDKQKPFLQHMSFEIPPNKESLRVAAQAIKDTFGPLPQAHTQTANMIAWTWKGKYTVWALKLDKDSLVSDGFNAYTAQDEGTVRIAVELDVHNHAHHE